MVCMHVPCDLCLQLMVCMHVPCDLCLQLMVCMHVPCDLCLQLVVCMHVPCDLCQQLMVCMHVPCDLCLQLMVIAVLTIIDGVYKGANQQDKFTAQLTVRLSCSVVCCYCILCYVSEHVVRPCPSM